MAATLLKPPELEVRGNRLHMPVSRPQGQFLASKAEHVLFCAGVGSGKTKAGAMWAVRELFRDEGAGFVGANTYNQLHRVTLKEFLAQLKQWHVPFVFNKRPPASWGDSPFPSHEGIVSALVGGQMRQVICSQLGSFDFLRGLEIRWFWIDETRDTPREAFDMLLGRKRGGPRDSQRPCAVTTTPDGFNWLYDAFVSNGEHALPAREVIYAHSASNPWLPPGYVQGLLSKYSKRLAQQEVGGKFVSLASGQAFAEFVRAEHIRADCLYDPKLDLVHTWDFNVNPLCSDVLQTDRGTVKVIDEIHIEGSARTRDATEEFLNRYRKHAGRVLVYGDRSGRSSNTSAESTDFEQIEQEYRKVFGDRLSMRPNYVNPPVPDSITDVNCMLKSAAGKVRLIVSPACECLIRDLEQVAFKPGTRDVDKSNPQLTHHSDALRYFVSAEFPARSDAAGGVTPKGW